MTVAPHAQPSAQPMLYQSIIPLFLAAALTAPAAPSTAPIDTGDPHDGEALASEAPTQTTKRLQWWGEARLGMFIHWGLYAQDGCFWRVCQPSPQTKFPPPSSFASKEASR
jgi:hypothetical protein